MSNPPAMLIGFSKPLRLLCLAAPDRFLSTSHASSSCSRNLFFFIIFCDPLTLLSIFRIARDSSLCLLMELTGISSITLTFSSGRHIRNRVFGNKDGRFNSSRLNPFFFYYLETKRVSFVFSSSSIRTFL